MVHQTRDTTRPVVKVSYYYEFIDGEIARIHVVPFIDSLATWTPKKFEHKDVEGQTHEAKLTYRPSSYNARQKVGDVLSRFTDAQLSAAFPANTGLDDDTHKTIRWYQSRSYFDIQRDRRDDLIHYLTDLVVHGSVHDFFNEIGWDHRTKTLNAARNPLCRWLKPQRPKG